MEENLTDASEYPESEDACHRPRMAGGKSLYDLLMSIKPDGLSVNAWTSRAKVSRSWFYDVRRGVTPRTDTLERIIGASGMTLAQFYDLEGARKLVPPPAESRELPFRGAKETLDIPHVGTAQGSDLEITENGEVAFVEQMDLDESTIIEYLRRPEALVGRDDVYVITVIGNSVAPRYEDGDPAYVSSTQKPHYRDFVVVQLKRVDGSDERLRIAVLKQLVRKTSTYIELHQTNPEVTFRIPLAEVHAIHRVIPWKELVFF